MSAVTVCIPAYRAEAFVDRTIRSVLAQTWPDVQVVVSVDPGNDGTARVVSLYEARGVRVVEQPHRLGWVGNINAALALAETSHAMILPHDDEIDPTYVAACMAALEAHPDAVLAYSDLAFGPLNMTEPSVVGDEVLRLETFLGSHFDAVAFRGVFDRSRAAQHRVPEFALANYAADTLWIGRMLVQGGIVRVPRVLYRKHRLPSSVHAAWSETSPEEMEEMWIVHCCEVDRLLREAGVRWNGRLEAAWVSRLLYGRNGGTAPPPQALDLNAPLRPQTEAIWARVRDRQPPYGWAAGR